MRTRTIAALVLAVSAAWIAACGTHSREFPVSDGPRPPWTQGRQCWITDAPEEALRSLFRPGLVANLDLWGLGTHPSDTTHLTLRFGADGRPEWARVVRSSLPAERRRSLERLVEEAVIRPNSGEGGLRLLLVGGELDHVLPSVICEPRIVQALSGFEVTGGGQRVDRQRDRPVHGVPVHLWLAADGSITGIRIDRPGVGPSLEQAVLVLLRQSRKWPKAQDGIPIASETRTIIRVPWNW